MDCFTLFLSTNNAISYADFKANWNINWANYLEIDREYDLEISLRTEPETEVDDIPDYLYHLKCASLAPCIRSCVAVGALPTSNPDTNTNISIGETYQTNNGRNYNTYMTFSIVFTPNQNVPIRILGLPDNDFSLEIRKVDNTALSRTTPFTAMLKFTKV